MDVQYYEVLAMHKIGQKRARSVRFPSYFIIHFEKSGDDVGLGGLELIEKYRKNCRTKKNSFICNGLAIPIKWTGASPVGKGLKRNLNSFFVYIISEKYVFEVSKSLFQA